MKTAHPDIPNLFALPLDDGLPMERAGQTIRYRQVHLRETTVADERWATRAAERVVQVQGLPRLLVSDDDFRLALNCRHIEKFSEPGLPDISGDLVDLELIGKLTPHDLLLIESRVFLVELAAQMRYGLISQEQFDAIVLSGNKGSTDLGGNTPPLPLGAAANVGDAAAAPGLGPQMLADRSGGGATGADSGLGR